MRVHVCVHVSFFLKKNTFFSICAYVYPCMCVCECVFVCVYVFVCVPAHVHVAAPPKQIHEHASLK